MKKLPLISAISAAVVLACGVASAAQVPLRVVATNAEVGTKPNVADVVANEVGGRYSAALSELKSLSRVRWALVPVAAGYVNIEDLGTYQLDELSGELRVVVRPELLQPQQIGAGSNSIVIPDADPALGMLIGYDVRAQSQSGRIETGVVWNAQTYLGVNRLELNGVAGNTVETQITRARLVRENLEDSSLIEAGTLSAKSGARGTPTAILGFGIRRDSGITPGYITAPQLRVDGLASGKSTVEVLIDNQRVSSSQVGTGPFTVVAAPPMNGGIASVVIKDELGQERIVSSQLYSNPSLLEIDQAEYGLWAGALNPSALKSKGFSASGFYRRGLTNWLTTEASFEKSSSTLFGGAVSRVSVAADVATMLGNFSVDLRGVGGAKQIATTYAGSRTWGDWTFSASGQAVRTEHGYIYVGGGVAPAYSRSGTLTAATNNLSGNLTLVASPGGNLAIVGFSYRIEALRANLNASVSRFTSGTRSANSLFVGLSIPFGGVNGSVSMRATAEGVSKMATISGQVADGVSAGLSAEGVDKVRSVHANMFARTENADLVLTTAKVENQRLAARASVRGGLVVHPGGVTLTRPQYGDAGYVVFNLGAPGVEVINGTGGKAVTNALGYAVLPMPALKNIKLDIDASTSPDGLDLTPVQTSTRRYGGVEVKRRAVLGQFVAMPATKGVLVIEGVSYPVTDRGVWVELAAGKYSGKIDGGENVSFEVK